jgi:hypothetical protein
MSLIHLYRRSTESGDVVSGVFAALNGPYCFHAANSFIAKDSSEPVGLKPLTDSMRDRQLQLNTVACAIAGSCDCQNRC